MIYFSCESGGTFMRPMFYFPCQGIQGSSTANNDKVRLILQDWTMSRQFDFEYIETNPHLEEFCAEISDSPIIAFDTEFVSEDCYQPQLCLIQIASGNNLAIVDSLAVGNQMPFWNLLVDGKHQTVVHAAREEFRFCRYFTSRRPSRLFDTQIGAGLVGLEFPAALSTLTNKLLGESLQKSETRTNWRKRPLTDSQLKYAISDVVFLEAIHAEVSQQLEKLGRLAWVDEEMDRQQTDYEMFETRDRWMRLPGATSMSPKELAIVREIWEWREQKAEKRNLPPKKILRDDLIIETAKRGLSSVKRIRSIRGMEYGRLKKYLPEISSAIERGLNLPRDQWPKKSKKDRIPNLGLLGQFLATALGVICRDASIAPNLVGTTQDLRTMAAWRLGLLQLDEPPALVTGWRGEVIGDEIDHVLQGQRSIRVTDPSSDQPLSIDPCD